MKQHGVGIGQIAAEPATFGWLCVETLPAGRCPRRCAQPPSGGCVLKHKIFAAELAEAFPATFGWLCVETWFTPRPTIPAWRQPPSGGCVLKQPEAYLRQLVARQPPSGGCVLKPRQSSCVNRQRGQPPSGGCVLKPAALAAAGHPGPSHLRVAVC